MTPIRSRWHDAGVLGVPPGTPGKQAAAAFALYGLRPQAQDISPGPVEATVAVGPDRRSRKRRPPGATGGPAACALPRRAQARQHGRRWPSPHTWAGRTENLTHPGEAARPAARAPEPVPPAAGSYQPGIQQAPDHRRISFGPGPGVAASDRAPLAHGRGRTLPPPLHPSPPATMPTATRFRETPARSPRYRCSSLPGERHRTPVRIWLACGCWRRPGRLRLEAEISLEWA
jgi:hypothetical protein